MEITDGDLRCSEDWIDKDGIYIDSGGDLLNHDLLETTSTAQKPKWYYQIDSAERTRLRTSHPESLLSENKGESKGVRQSVQVALMIVAYRSGLLSKFKGLRRLNRITKIMSLTTFDAVIDRVNEYSEDYGKFRRLWIQHGQYLDRSTRSLRRANVRTRRLLGVGYRDKGSPPNQEGRIIEAAREFGDLLDKVGDKSFLSIVDLHRVMFNPHEHVRSSPEDLIRAFRWRLNVFSNTVGL